MREAASGLEKLAKTGKYLFHGSPTKMEVIEPRQAYNNSQPDGEPAVVATSFYQLAIFRAIMLAARAQVSPGHYQSGFSFSNGKLSFRANKETLTTARSNITGFVYVLDKGSFRKHSSMEYRASASVRPVRVFEVGANDLSEEIETVD